MNIYFQLKMGVRDYVTLFLNYTAWFIYILLNITYNFIRSLFWRTNGVHQLRVASRRPENYATSAHVKKIVFKHILDSFMLASEFDFVTVHQGFTHPECVLHDDWSLYAITPSEAVFVLKQPGWPHHLFHSNFYIFGQFDSAVQVLTMPLNQFNRVTEEMQGDGAQMIFLQNQARAGGTLLTSIFKDSGKCVCFNEPHCYTGVCTYIFSDNIWHGATAQRLYKNTVRMMCKPYHGLGDRVLAYVIKPTSMNMVAIEMSHEVFPDARHFFIYREPISVAISLRRIGQVLPTLKLMYYLPNLPRAVAFLIRLIGYPNNDFRGWTCVVHPELEFGYRLACTAMYHYLLALRRGIDMHGIRYVDLVDNPDRYILEVLAICKLPASLADKAKAAMYKDSQEHSPISRKLLKRALPNPPNPTPEFLKIAQATAEEFGIPGPDKFADKSFHLENSILP